MSDEHTSFIKTPKQLAIVMVLAFAVPIVLIVLISQLVTGMKPAGERGAPKTRCSSAFGRSATSQSPTSPMPATRPASRSSRRSARPATKAVSPARRSSATRRRGRRTIKDGFETLVKNAHQRHTGRHGKVMPPQGRQPGSHRHRNRARGGLHGQRRRGELQGTCRNAPLPRCASSTCSCAHRIRRRGPDDRGAGGRPKRCRAGCRRAARHEVGAGDDAKERLRRVPRVDKKIVGPAYQDVAAKYRGDKDAMAKLVQKVKTGGSGVWGAVPMPPNAQMFPRPTSRRW